MKYTKQYIVELVNNSKCIKDIIKLIDLNYSKSNRTMISDLIRKYEINTDHFEDQRKGQNAKRKELKDYLVSQDEFTPHNNLKQKLYNSGLKQPICELCGQNEIWRGKKISLILDHVDGNRYNNVLSNLRIVCPNCNATLDTHCGKNRNKYLPNKKPTRQITQIKESKINFTNRGYLLEVGELMGWTPQYSGKFIKTHIPELWEKCYKHKGAIVQTART